MKFEEWADQYKVLTNPAQGGKLFFTDNPQDKDFITQIGENHVWTEKREADGPKVVNGVKYLDQTGFCYITELPWLDGEEITFDVSRNYKYNFVVKKIIEIMVERFNLDKVTDVPREECEALVALYVNTTGPRWNDSSNWLVTPEVGTWKGIEVENGHIATIDMNQNHLFGTIPTELGNLPFLRKLDLRDNHIRGTIPANLTHLTIL